MSEPFGPRAPGDLSVVDLVRSYRDLKVLKGLTLHVPQGTVAAVIGANGSGKTTLLRTLAGSLDPSAGDVRVLGGPTGHGHATFVPAGDRMLNWRLSAEQNLSFFARLAGFTKAERPGRIHAAAAALDADDLLDRPVGTCSTGQRRRIMLAVGVLPAAPVLLLDEPFADLDDAGRAVVAGVCHGWARAGGVVLYATPSEGDGPLADARMHLVDGRIAEGA
jgi:ABC-type multidrug transport system ATPase subunit